MASLPEGDSVPTTSIESGTSEKVTPSEGSSGSTGDTVIESLEGAVGGTDTPTTSDPTTPTTEEAGTGTTERAVRTRVATDRGLEYQQELRSNNLRVAIRRWRRKADEVEDAFAECYDADTLCTHRNALQDTWNEVENAAESLRQVSVVDDSVGMLEHETRQLRRDLNSRIKELKDELRSASSRKPSKSTKRSTSSRHSTKTMKVEAAAKAAEIEVALKYHAAEHELKRVKLQKELDIAHARLHVITETEEYSTAPSLPETTEDTTQRVESYIRGLQTEANLQEDVTAAGTVPLSTTSIALVGAAAQGYTLPGAASMPTTSASVTLPATTATMQRSYTSGYPMQQPDASFASLSAPSTFFGMNVCSAVTTPLLATRARTTESAFSNTGHVLNPSVPPFVPASAVTRSWSFPVPTTRQEQRSVSYPVPTVTTPVFDISSQPMGLYPQHVLPSGHSATMMSVPPHYGSAMDSTRAMVDLAAELHVSRIPIPEPPVFSGDPLDYASWKSAFETLIENKHIPPAERIHYLKRYLSGKARECVEGYFLFTSDSSFAEAKALLDKRFGDKDVIQKAFREKLDKYPKIAPRDYPGLLRFSDFLRQCLAASNAFSCMSSLNDPEQNMRIQAKLPQWVVNRWGDAVKKAKTFPSFPDFVKFLVDQADGVNHPFIYRQTDKSDKTGKGDKSQRKSKLALASSSKEQDTPKKKKSQARKKSSKQNEEQTTKAESSTDSDDCVFCKQKHHLDMCEKFLEKPREDRKEFAKANTLCYGCLKPGHISKKCKCRATCSICSRRHPTALHAEKKEDGTPFANNPTPDNATTLNTAVVYNFGVSSSSSTSMILPVYVSLKDNPGYERLVYAIMDTQSDACFISERTCAALNATGPEVKLRLSTLSAKDEVITSEKVSGIQVRGYFSSERAEVPPAFTRPEIPVNTEHIPTPETARRWPHLECIADKMVPLQDVEIGLLIGYNCKRLLIPRQVIASDNGPFAQKTDLGWGIIGETSTKDDSSSMCFRVSTCVDGGFAKPATIEPRLKAKELFTPIELIQTDESEPNSDSDFKYSYNDTLFLKKMKSGIVQTDDGHYTMPLPLKEPVPCLPDNKGQALSRLDLLRRKFLRNSQFREEYTAFMDEIIAKGFAEIVEQPGDTADGHNVWYIPHHGVFHPKKKKIRVVFDCSARFNSVSLNDLLLPGPDLTNDLLGVLLRFRREQIALTCDIQKMFYQFRVHENDRDYLRFVWWPNGDMSHPPTTYRMTVHLFGASSSPACSNYGLKQAAHDGEEEFGTPAADFVRSNFYVDDGLVSTATIGEAIDLAANTKALCAKAGIRLHKFATNSPDVLESIPIEDRADGMQNLDIFRGDSAIERALGLEWNIKLDCFQFSLTMKDRPMTRRGLLSAVTSLFDPIGLLSPVILVGKQILQDICRLQLAWDEALPQNIVTRWEAWRKDLQQLETLEVQRCYRPADFSSIKEVQLHHFSDASQLGYGQCSYIRMIDDQNRIHCSLVMAKARVAPVRPVTIPRLELSAAVLSVRIAKYVRQQLSYENVTEVFWTDSDVVLGYISNDARRFHVYVANRVAQIRSYTDPSQWFHVDTTENPADLASRGCSVSSLINRELWFSGPRFLWDSDLPHARASPALEEDDPEVKRVLTTTTRHSFASLAHRMQRFSDWHRARRAIANCVKYVRILRDRVRQSTNTSGYASTVADLCSAEVIIVKAMQAASFGEQIELLSDNTRNETGQHKYLAKRDPLYKLDPFVDSSGLLRVGGRLASSSLSESEKHPIILPKQDHITHLIVHHYHQQINHQGRGMTINQVRAAGYWIIGCNRVVRSIISKCVICRKWRSNSQTQKMASLPEDRVEASEPFSYCAVDLFGPFLIKERRSELKRYGVLFTCLCSRAVHIETANSLSTDSFINALRRMIAIRGPIRHLRCDQGTNFVGAKLEFDRELKRMDQDKVAQFLQSKGCDFIEFKFNVPSASHMGGVWERQIRSARSILLVLLEQSSTQLDDESLRTFMYETANIINARPLTVDSLNDPLSARPLTPNHILTMKSSVVLPPPGNFVREDLFLHKKWRRVQHLLNAFWTRWKKEYIQSLQSRQKWNTPKRNLEKGDIVIIRDENLPRNQWLLGCIEDLMPSKDGLIREVKVRVADSTLDKNGRRTKAQTILERPIHKLVLLLEGGQGIPNEEPHKVTS